MHELTQAHSLGDRGELIRRNGSEVTLEPATPMYSFCVARYFSSGGESVTAAMALVEFGDFLSALACVVPISSVTTT